MAPNPRRKRPASPLAAHPTLGTAGNDAWQRQADAAAWSAVSGMAPSLYLGAIEPIPVPADLRARLRDAGRALAAEPSDARAVALLRIAHEAVYGAPAPESLFPAATLPACGVSMDDWWQTPGDTQKPACDPANLAQFAAEAFAALQAAEHDPADQGEAAPERDWWAA